MSILQRWNKRNFAYLFSYVRLFLTVVFLFSFFLPSAFAEEAYEDVPIHPSSQEKEITEILIQGAPLPVSSQKFEGSVSTLTQYTASTHTPGAYERGSIEEVLGMVPGLSWAGGTNRPRFFQIRGIGEYEQYEGIPNPSVGVLLDGVDISGLGIPTGLYDVKQIEVFRGPQAFRFGASALAGGISITTEEPTSFYAGKLSLTSGSEALRGGTASVSTPLSPTFSARLSVSNLHSDGFRRNEFLHRDDTNERNDTIVKGKLRARVGTQSFVELQSTTTRSNNGYDAFAVDNSFVTQSNQPGSDDLHFTLFALRGHFLLTPEVVLETTSSLYNSSQRYSYDGDWGNSQFWEPYVPYEYYSDTFRTRKVAAQEVRLLHTTLDPLLPQWSLGIYGQKFKEENSIHEYSEQVEYDAIASDLHSSTGSLFGYYKHPLSEKLSFSLGYREERRWHEYHDSKDSAFSPLFSLRGGDASLLYDLTKTIVSSASLSRGFKNGGFNPGTDVPLPLRTYAPEYLWNLEWGIKGKLFNEKLTFATSLFTAWREDQQIKQAFQSNPSDPLTFTYITQNAAKGRQQGFEMETAWSILPKTSILFTGSLLSTKLTKAPDPSLQGREQSYAPRWQYNASITQRLPFSLFTQAGVEGRDSYYFDDSHNQRSSPYHLARLAGGYESPSLRLFLWIKNVFNQRHAVRGFYFGNEPPDFASKLYVQQGDPRQIGVTLEYQF